VKSNTSSCEEEHVPQERTHTANLLSHQAHVRSAFAPSDPALHGQVTRFLRTQVHWLHNVLESRAHGKHKHD
jgi:hypothetical protein